MSTNPQWKTFQPPDTMNQDSAIIDFKSVTANGKFLQKQTIHTHVFIRVVKKATTTTKKSNTILEDTWNVAFIQNWIYT